MSSRLDTRRPRCSELSGGETCGEETLKRNRTTGWLLAGSTLGLFALLSCFVLGDNDLTRLDAGLSSSMLQHARRTPALATVFRTLTTLGDSKSLAAFSVLVAVALAVGIVRGRRQSDLLLFWFMGSVGAGLLNALLKAAFQRPRPDPEIALVPATGWSYPSGHAMGSLILFGMTLYLVARFGWGRTWRILATVATALLVLGVGLSRVYVGAHWPSDVVGGYLAGMCWLAVAITGVETYRGRRQPPKGSVAAYRVQRLEQPPTTGSRPPAPWRRAKNAEGGPLVGQTAPERRE